MKLFKVRIEYETVILAHTWDEAQLGAESIVRESDDTPVHTDVGIIESLNDLPPNWDKDCRPWGQRDPMDRTIGQIIESMPKPVEWTPTPEQIRAHRAHDYYGGVAEWESDEQVISRLQHERQSGKKTFAWQTTSGADLP